jgi:AraC-like DNA-binding protein
LDRFGVELLWASRYYHTKGRLDEHAHAYYQIIYFVDGKGIFTYDQAAYDFGPGTLIFIRPLLRHSFIADDQAVIKTLDIKFYISDPALADLTAMIEDHSADAPLEILYLMEHIREEGAQKKRFFGELACSYLVQLLYLLSRYPTEQAPQSSNKRIIESKPEKSSAAECVRNYIAEHYMEDLNIIGISNKIGYSKKYIGQAFIHTFKCTISDYIKKIRIEKSKELIMYSEHTLKEIAAAVGFKSIHHFSRVFKQAEGTTPGHWYTKEKQGIRKEITF